MLGAPALPTPTVLPLAPTGARRAEVGLHPSTDGAIEDLGSWIWSWTDDDQRFGDAPRGDVVEADPVQHPASLRPVRTACPFARKKHNCHAADILHPLY
ncbi:MAG: hypothetical protein CL927_17645 [Deltaproteobacteria bacterium]|nr:hypothetical protein [Deltaproteobacteria bacterium]HCH66547.1 hypothetical protein [Deltaproteobacteria bacterium]